MSFLLSIFLLFSVEISKKQDFLNEQNNLRKKVIFAVYYMRNIHVKYEPEMLFTQDCVGQITDEGIQSIIVSLK